MKNRLSKEKLAKSAIEEFVIHGRVLSPLPVQVSGELRKRLACFVTIYVNNNLRGCIGTIEPVDALYISIINNAIAAASEDYRFPPVTRSELPCLTAEVSVLSPIKPFPFRGKERLIDYLKENKPGLVLEKYGRKALFLPQVWDELPEAAEFLKHLSAKAGLSPDDWENNTQFWTFTVTR